MDILDIFYNQILEEASNGKINSYFTYNILFDTYLEEDNKKIFSNLLSNGVVTPLLIINNKSVFNELLIRYVTLAKEYYKDTLYYHDLISETTKENIFIEKNIIALLWSNATIEDFSNPIEYLQRRIKFLENNMLTDETNYGYVDILKGNLSIEIKKDEIYNETPYELIISLTSELNEKFIFPAIKFAIIDDVLYIYAIQNNYIKENSYSKKINRILYKINEGFDEFKNLPEIYGIDNLKDVTSSFVVALNIALAYFKNLGINKIVASSILLTRWNAKRLAIEKRFKGKEEYADKILEQERIQHNLTEKFLRTFLRLKVHYDNYEILSYPFEIDSNIHIDISNMNNCNNELLKQTQDIINPLINSKK